MASEKTSPFILSVALGFIAGMRSFSAPAVVSHVYSRHPSAQLSDTPLAFIQTNTASKIFKVLAAGELVGDKLPWAPNRTTPPALAFRILSGAIAGGTVSKAKGNHVLAGAAIGAAAAVASTFACFLLRRSIGKSTRIPDAVTAVIEDALVIGTATAIAKQL